MGSFLAICRMHLLLVVVLCVRLMMMERCKVTTKLAVTFTHYLLLLSCSSFVSSCRRPSCPLPWFRRRIPKAFHLNLFYRHADEASPSHRSRNNQCQQHSSPLCIFTGFIGLPGHLFQIMADCKKRYTFSLSEGRPWLAISPRFLWPEI